MKGNVKNMTMNEYISQELEKYKDKSLNRSYDKVPGSFFYYYGPYMCMETGFEQVVDEIVKERHFEHLHLMQVAAFCIRRFQTISYGEVKNMIKEVISDLEVRNSSYFEKDSYREAIRNLVTKYLIDIRKYQHEKGDLESFITGSAPIVTYQQTIVSPHNDFSHIKVMREEFEDKKDEEDLDKLLTDNLRDIMLSYKLCEAQVDPMHIIDGYTIEDDKYPFNARLYYAKALSNFHGIPTEKVAKNMALLEQMTDIQSGIKTKFEGLLGEFLNNSIQIYQENKIRESMESWDDPTLSDDEEDEVEKLLDEYLDTNINPGENSEPQVGVDCAGLNLDPFYNFVSVRRSIKCDEWAKRMFTELLQNHQIINVTTFMDKMTIYQLDNYTLVMPYTDLVDWGQYAAFMEKDAENIEVVNMLDIVVDPRF